MSSFFAIINGTTELIKKAKNVSGLTRSLTNTSTFTLLADPPSDRLFYVEDNPNSQGWIVSGIGLHPYPDLHLLTKENWNRVLTTKISRFEQLNGHFAGIFYSNSEIKLFTDAVGLRSLYLCTIGKTVFISTRIDWLIPFSDQSIDWSLFAPFWLAANPFSGQSFVKGITRLRGNASYSLSTSKLVLSQQEWLPGQQSVHIEGFLSKLAVSIYEKKGQLLLGLSGGLDSRVLLALFANQNPPISTYTFGGIGHPDESVVHELVEKIGVEHQSINYVSSDFSLEKLSTLTLRSSLKHSIFGQLTNALYQQLGNQGLASIDGGVGEIGRRRYLKNLELRGKKFIYEQNYEQLIPFFYAPKADFFNNEVNQRMHNGLKHDLESACKNMPDVNQLGLGNWLDLFSIRTRISNIAGLTQEGVDDTHFHIMPFAQNDFLTGILSLPENERVNAKLFRSLIKKHQPILTQIPLVKGDQPYPYWMKDVTATIWNKLQSRFGRSYTNTMLPNLLHKHQTEIRDLFSSKAVQNSEVYDTNKVAHILSSFYELNDYTFTSSLNWMLTFELYRKSLSDAC